MENVLLNRENQDITLNNLSKLKETKCRILDFGTSPAKETFYICVCDPEQKEPICKSCFENCHKGHDFIKKIDTEAICNCGLKMHEIISCDNEKNEVFEKCIFSEWTENLNVCLIYKEIASGTKICAFCINFCRINENFSNNIQFKEFSEFILINSNKETFDKINNNIDIEKKYQNNCCECTNEIHRNLSKIVKNFIWLFFYKNNLNLKNNDKNENNEFIKNNLILNNNISNLNVYKNSQNILNLKPGSIENNEFNDLVKDNNNTDYNHHKSEINCWKNDFINDIEFQKNKREQKYIEKKIFKYDFFRGLNLNHLINLLLNSETKIKNNSSLFGSFNEELKSKIKNEINSENFQWDRQKGFTNFTLYLNFLRLMAESIKLINYTNYYQLEDILIEEENFAFLNKKFDFNNINIWNVKNNLLYIYYKFVFKKDFARFPKLKIHELYNIDPLQHLLIISNANIKDFPDISKKYLKNPKFLNMCIKNISKFSEIKENNIHKCEIIKTLYRILCHLAKWNSFTQENMLNFCNVSVELIYKFNYFNNQNKIYNHESESCNNLFKKNFLIMQIKILIKIVKIHIYLILNFNNDIIYKILKTSGGSLTLNDLDKKNFIMSDNEVGRSINKNIITLMNFSINLKKFNLREIKKFLNYLNMMHTLSFEYPDNYVISIRRILDKNKEIYINLIDTEFEEGEKKNFGNEEIEILKFIINENEKLDNINQNFHRFEQNYDKFQIKFYQSLKEVLSKYGILYYVIPEVDFNLNNFEFDIADKAVSRDGIQILKIKNNQNKTKIFEKPLRIFGDIDDLISLNENSNKQDEFMATRKFLLKLKIMINKSFYVNTLINGLKIIILIELNKKRELDIKIDDAIFNEILRFLYFYIEDNIDNCFAILNSNLFELIIYLNIAQVDLLLNYLSFILVNLLKNKADFASSKEIIKICKIIHNKILMNSDDLKLMLKFINILKLITDFSFIDEAYVYHSLRKLLKEFYKGNKVLLQFKSFLLNLTNSSSGELSNRNTRDNFLSGEKRSIYNSIIINSNNLQGGSQLFYKENNNYNLNHINEKSNTKNSNLLDCNNSLNNNMNTDGENIDLMDTSNFQHSLIIYTVFLKLINFNFDGNATLNEEKFLYSILNHAEIQQILSKKDLNIKLRLEILKFFRIIYIDVIIDIKKIEIYRSFIINPISGENNDDSLDDSLQYRFFNNLMGINSNHSNLGLESYIIKFELKNFEDIMKSFDDKNKFDLNIMDYFENGILMPLYIFLNKFMSIIFNLKGKEYLNLYEIVIYFLKVKKNLIQNYLGKEKESNIKGNIFKKLYSKLKNRNQLFKKVNKEESILQINKDLEILNKRDFEIFNYKLVYSYFEKHFDDFIISNHCKTILEFFKKKESIYSDKKIGKLKNIFKEGEMLNNSFETKVFNLIMKYENDKKNFQNSSFLTCLDEHNLEFKSNYRCLLIRSLFYLINDLKYSKIYKKKILAILFKLLQYQTGPIQQEIFQLYGKSKDSIGLDFIVNLFLENFISIIFSSCNPSNVNSNEDYYISLLIIKILKYLCEEHNKNFQKIFFMELKFEYFIREELINEEVEKVNNFTQNNSYNFNGNTENHYINSNKPILQQRNSNNIEKETDIDINKQEKPPNNKRLITFFDLMVCILGKIIIISKWKKIDLSKSLFPEQRQNNFFSDIFFGIIELLIEMIQGTDEVNLGNIKLETRGENNQFYNFLNISKNILYHEDHNSSIVNNSRKNIIEFLIAFLEEKSTPKKLVQLIASVFSPYSIFEAIIKILKKIFIMTHPNYNNRIEIFIRFYNKLIFNPEIKDFFHNTYFKDKDFCLKDEFELANRMFQFVKLLADKFQNDEANNLFNSISNEIILHNKIKLKIENIQKNNKIENSRNRVINNNQKNKPITEIQTNKNLNINQNNNINVSNLNVPSQQNISSVHNNLNWRINSNSNYDGLNTIETYTKILERDKFFECHNLDRSNDTTDYEIINIINFFEGITRKVFVQNGEEQAMVLFTLNPSIPYLSENTKIDFYENVNRESRYSKLYSLMEYCEYFQIEITYNFERSKYDIIFVLFNKLNFKFLEFLLFFLLLIINFIMFAKYENSHLIDGQQKLSDVVFALGLSNVILNSIAIIIWLYTKFQLYYNIEKKKFSLKYKIENPNNISKWNRYFIIPIIETIVKKNETNGFMWNVIFSAIAISNKKNHYWFALQTLIVINLSKILKLLINAVLLKYKQLLACVFSLIIIVFFFTSIAFFYMSEDYLANLQTV